MQRSTPNRRDVRTPRITIVTPCYNAGRYIADTVSSVVSQTAVMRGRMSLEYIICDGGSTDDTVERARNAAGASATVISEPDTGMYDALAKGLRRANGDIVAYINAGDYYHPSAFEVVADLFDQDGLSWLTGYSVTYNERGDVTSVVLPFRYRRGLVASGAYDGTTLPFIQQESTFWRRELLASVDLDRLAQFRLAGDAYLWSCFASACELHVVESYLGGFRRHQGQLSEARAAYWEEFRSFIHPMSIPLRVRAWIDALLWRCPPKLKKRMNSELLHRFDDRSGSWQ